MENPQNAGPGENRAEPAIRFKDLTPKQQDAVRNKVSTMNPPADNQYWEAEDALNAALKSELDRLSKEPVSTAALFLVTGAFFDFASQVLNRIGRVQAGKDDCLEIDEPGYLSNGGVPDTTKHLVEAYIREQEENPYWAAHYAEHRARNQAREEERRMLDEAAAEMFGNGK